MSPPFFQSVRYPASVVVLFLGWFLIGEARGVWTRYWILKDEQQAIALVTREHDRNVVDYSYRVRGREYKGTDSRRYLLQEHQYQRAGLGGETVIYYSSSHPWLSTLTPPTTIIPDGFGGVLIFMAFEVWFVITLIDPDNKWAYKLPQRPTASQKPGF